MDFPALTCPRCCANRRGASAQHTAIRQKDFGIWRPLSFADYFNRASHVGLGLRSLGLQEGGHVAIISENGWNGCSPNWARGSSMPSRWGLLHQPGQ